MTKKIKGFWLRMSFWNKTRSIITAIVALVEGALFLQQSDPTWRWVSLGGGIIVIFITHLIEDRNDNGTPDIFERDNNVDDGL